MDIQTEITPTPETHYTSAKMATALFGRLKIPADQSILDAGSGRNKVWFDAFGDREKYECELERGQDFYKWTQQVDWVIGNPPFKEASAFIEHAATVARVGMGWLLNHNALNSLLLPNRMQRLADLGWVPASHTVVGDKRWFGRYHWLVFKREGEPCISWIRETF